MKKIILITIVLCLLIYGGASFYSATFNPVQWHLDVRFIVLIAWLTMIYLTMMFAVFVDLDYKTPAKN